MSYTLTVVKRIPNPDFVKQCGEWQERNRYRNTFPDDRQDPYPSQFLEERSVMVELKEDEWDAIRQALISHWCRNYAT